MTEAADRQRVTLSVDAMGGDNGPRTVIDGLAVSARKNPELDFILHGPEGELEPLVARKKVLGGRVQIVHAEGVVEMGEKPSHALRHGRGTSMWSAIESVRDGHASAVISCGNTGALMALSMLRLRRLPGVNRPAIAILWPARSAQGFNVVLDVGADVRADPKDLMQFALMGVSYARTGLGVAIPRVGILNNGTEETKGHSGMHDAFELIRDAADAGDFIFKGFVEGGDMPADHVDVIVTDGFTGNIALKTAEGTASMVRQLVKETFSHNILSRFAALLAAGPLMRLRKRIDPRRVNGGVFLGLQGMVVKSHGSADAISMSAAIKLGFRLTRSDFDARLRQQLEAASEATGRLAKGEG